MYLNKQSLTAVGVDGYTLTYSSCPNLTNDGLTRYGAMLESQNTIYHSQTETVSAHGMIDRSIHGRQARQQPWHVSQPRHLESTYLHAIAAN